MSESAAKSAFPEEAVKKLVAMLQGKLPFERWAAVTAALELAQYLTDVFGSDATVKAKNVKSPRLSKKAVVDALRPYAGGADATVKALPAWVLPMLLKLAQKWLENKE